MTTNTKMTSIRLFFQAIAISLVLLFVSFGGYYLYHSNTKLANTSVESPLMGFRQAQSDYELQLSQTTREMLEQVVGAGQVQVGVRADVDFEQTQKTQEVLDGQNPVIASTSGDDVSYAFSKQTTQTSLQGGKIRKLAVTVLLDSQHRSYSAAEQNKIKALIYSSVAFDETRGDTLELILTPFIQAPFWQQKSVQAIFFFAAIILLTALLGAVWVRGMKLSENTVDVPVFTAPDFTNPRVAGAVAASAQIEGAVAPNALKKAQLLMQKNPNETLTVLRGWICQGDENAS